MLAMFIGIIWKIKFTIIELSKIDNVDYAQNQLKHPINQQYQKVTVLRMSVPCCGGLVYAVQKALMDSNKMIPWQVVTIGTDGSIMNQ